MNIAWLDFRMTVMLPGQHTHCTSLGELVENSWNTRQVAQCSGESPRECVARESYSVFVCTSVVFMSTVVRLLHP
jgi:hypothetical protein